MPRIVFTGGGTAGHVIPAMALFKSLQEQSWEIYYIGSYQGIEKELITKEGIPYNPISTGKLRRYFSWQNFSDPLRIMRGLFQARQILRRIKPQLVFSKGGFVAVPVVAAASLLGIPVILHESDITPGLANRLAVRFADQILTTFPETVHDLPATKARYTGTPIRRSLLQGDADQGRQMCDFTDEKPILMAIGGSTGARVINENLRNALGRLLEDFQIVHLCGKGNVVPKLQGQKGYCQFDYINEEMPNIFAMTDLIISRAGANTLFEILQLQLPNILIPLSAKVSRGDQIQNAKSFASQGFSKVLVEETLSKELLIDTVREVYQDREKYQAAMRSAPVNDSNNTIIGIINQYKG